MSLNQSLKTGKTANLPGGIWIRILPANAKDTGSIPGPGGLHGPWGNRACAPQQLKPVRPAAREPQLSSPCARAPVCSAAREAATATRSSHTNEGALLPATRESPRAATKTQPRQEWTRNKHGSMHIPK